MTREELIEAMARAISLRELIIQNSSTQRERDYDDDELRAIAAHEWVEWAASAGDALSALEAAGVRLVPVEELEDLLAGPAAWLDRWAEHVGTCWGGDQCACGLTLARHELAGAREALAASPYALKEIEVFQELAKRQEPLGAEFEAAIGDPSTLYET